MKEGIKGFVNRLIECVEMEILEVFKNNKNVPASK